MFPGQVIIIPLIDELLRNRQRTSFMSGIRLPRHARHVRSKFWQQLVVELVLEQPIELCLKYCLQQFAVKERQLEFQSVQIDILKMRVELLTLIVIKQKETDAA